MKQLIFATHNQHKAAEIQPLLEGLYRVKHLDEIGITEDIAETGETLEANAEIKARYVYEKTGLDCFADDTGLEVAALNGAPGVRSARFAGEQRDSNDNMKLLLERLADNPNRKARFRTVICLIISGQLHQFEGIVNGEVTMHQSGTDGFGYDPVFKPESYEITFAEMPLAEKNAISHRGRALQEMIQFLGQLS